MQIARLFEYIYTSTFGLFLKLIFWKRVVSFRGIPYRMRGGTLPANHHALDTGEVVTYIEWSLFGFSNYIMSPTEKKEVEHGIHNKMAEKG